MTKNENTIITVQTIVNAPPEKVWAHWTSPDSIKGWNNASDDWHTPWAENDLREKGKFSYRMEAKDGSFGFDFGGIYDSIVEQEEIAYTIGDGRKVHISFHSTDGRKTEIVESFEAEGTHSIDAQRGGWQAILDNFKKYTESAG
jgi:uncharacterized protein YndB with AHSA1/START domain